VANWPSDCSFAFCARLFSTGLASLVARIVEEPADTFLNCPIFDAFAALPRQDQERVVAENRLTGRIIASFETSFGNGQITRLAELLNALDPQPPFLETDEWRTFVREHLDVRVANCDRPFVPSAVASDVSDGPTAEIDVPTLSSDDSYSDDELPIDFVSTKGVAASDRSDEGEGVVQAPFEEEDDGDFQPANPIGECESDDEVVDAAVGRRLSDDE
jgi:hypothetical protein